MIRLLCFQFLSPTTSASQSAYHTVHVSMLLFMSFVWSDLEYNPTTYTMWVATPSSRGSSQPRDWTQVSHTRASLVAQSIKNLPAMWETRVWSLGWEKSPGGGHGNALQYLCLENPHGQRSLAGCNPGDHKESDMTKQLSTHTQY